MKVKVRLTNRYAEFIGPYPHEQFRKLFGYQSPSAYFSPLYKKFGSDGKRLWDGIVSSIRYNKVSAGLFLTLKKKIEAEWDLKFVIDDVRVKPKFRKLKTEDLSDRSYQNKCIRRMKKFSKTGGIVLCATGVGKTRIAAQYLKSLIGYAVFIVDELTLLKQAQWELQSVLGEEVGYIGNMVFEPRRVTVATAQTLHRHRFDKRFRPWTKKLEVVFVDELHVMLNKRTKEIISNIHPKTVIGLTATLQHQKKHIKIKATELTGPIIYEYPLEQGVEENYLTPGIIININVVKGGYPHLEDWPEYDRLIAKSKFFNNIIERIVRAGIKKDKYIISLVKRPKHVRILSKRIKDIAHDTVYGARKVRDRFSAKQQFDKKKLKVLIANQVFKKGISINRVNFIIDAAQEPSQNDAVQKYGRGVRLCKNKSGLIYIDIGFVNPPDVDKHSFNYNRFSKATVKRRKALARLGVPVYTLEWKDNPNYILKFAQRKLDKLVRQRLNR